MKNIEKFQLLENWVLKKELKTGIKMFKIINLLVNVIRFFLQRRYNGYTL
jgi:hypothetical protein